MFVDSFKLSVSSFHPLQIAERIQVKEAISVIALALLRLIPKFHYLARAGKRHSYLLILRAQSPKVITSYMNKH